MKKLPDLENLTSETLLRPGEAAQLLGVTTRALAGMPGLTVQRLPSGHRRYFRAEIEALSKPTIAGARRSGRRAAQ